MPLDELNNLDLGSYDYNHVNQPIERLPNSVNPHRFVSQIVKANIGPDYVQAGVTERHDA